VERPGPVDALVELLRERRVQWLQVPGSFPLEHADSHLTSYPKLQEV
jgi:hypothetical protein